MARLKTSAVVVDTVQLKRELQALGDATRAAVAELARQSLQAQIDAINAAATQRASALASAGLRASSGTQDRPLANAHVIISERRSSFGSRGQRVIVYVDHPIFNMLDAGTKDRAVKQRFVFPVYEGHVTPADGVAVGIGDPAVIKDRIVPGNVTLKRDGKGRPVLASPLVGSRLAGIRPRRFYKATAAWVARAMIGQRIVTPSKRSVLRLKENDVKVTATDQPRFNV